MRIWENEGIKDKKDRCMGCIGVWNVWEEVRSCEKDKNKRLKEYKKKERRYLWVFGKKEKKYGWNECRVWYKSEMDDFIFCV